MEQIADTFYVPQGTVKTLHFTGLNINEACNFLGVDDLNYRRVRLLLSNGKLVGDVSEMMSGYNIDSYIDTGEVKHTQRFNVGDLLIDKSWVEGYSVAKGFGLRGAEIFGN